jgi:hypothetical protein
MVRIEKHNWTSSPSWWQVLIAAIVLFASLGGFVWRMSANDVRQDARIDSQQQLLNDLGRYKRESESTKNAAMQALAEQRSILIELNRRQAVIEQDIKEILKNGRE